MTQVYLLCQDVIKDENLFFGDEEQSILESTLGLTIDIFMLIIFYIIINRK